MQSSDPRGVSVAQERLERSEEPAAMAKIGNPLMAGVDGLGSSESAKNRKRSRLSQASDNVDVLEGMRQLTRSMG